MMQTATEQQQGNIGTLYRAMAEVNGNDVLNGEIVAALQSLEPTNRPEFTLKQVLQVLLSEEDQLIEENEVLLREVAQRCPIDDGFGVYIARSALLRVDTLPKHYTSDCERIPSSEEIAEKRSSEKEHGFMVYPNPTNGLITLNYALDEGDRATLSVYTYTGALIQERVLNDESLSMDIDLTDVETGLYILSVDVNGETQLLERISVITP